jgi:enoyl-CoA hydratase/carnithine racemase
MPSADPQALVAQVLVPPTLSQQALTTFRAALATALTSATVRVVVLRGGTEAFCAGLDLSEISEEMADESASPWFSASLDFTAALQTILEAKPITLAVVEGKAMGGGVGLLAACDLVLAGAESSFALPELVLGLVPAMILPVIGARLGLHQAKRWAMTQTTWQAGEAKSRGLIDEVAAKDRVEADLKRMLRTLTRLHPRGVNSLKQLTRKLSELDLVSGMREGQTTLCDLLRQPQVRAEIAAFRDYGILPGSQDA